MISVVVAAVVGFLAARMLWLAMRKSWNSPTLMRENFHGVTLPTAAGVVLSFTLILVEGLRAVFGDLNIGEEGGLSPMRDAALIVVVGFTLLGLIDDLAGNAKSKGLAGHLKALASGTLTTGGIKFMGGIAVSLIGASLLGTAGIFDLVISAGVIALAANLANLFDLRPGRSTKVSVIAFAVLAIGSGLDQNLVSVAIVIGAAVALFLDDMHERLMLGDTGANAMGAALGLGAVAVTGQSGSLIIFAVLMALTLLSEFVSFTKIFDSVGPLRAFDQLGRKSGSSTGSAPRQTSAPVAPPAPMPSSELPEEGPPVDLREEILVDRFEEDDIDESNESELRTTVGSAHVGEPASSSAIREQSPFTSSSSRERSATRSIFPDDEFEDAPDFFSPNRNSNNDRPSADRASAAEPLPGFGQPRNENARRSPFDDDEDF